jgi:hypothetical protein
MPPFKPLLGLKYNCLFNVFGLGSLEVLHLCTSYWIPIIETKKPLIHNVCCGAHDLKDLTFVFPSSCNKHVIDLTKHDGLKFEMWFKKKKQRIWDL